MKIFFYFLSIVAVCAQIRTDAGLTVYWQTNTERQAVLYVVGHATNQIHWDIKGHSFSVTNASGTNAPAAPDNGSCTNDFWGVAGLTGTYASGQFVEYWGYQFTGVAGYPMCGAALYVLKTGNPTGNTSISLHLDSGTNTPGTLVAASEEIDQTTLAAEGYWRYNFTNNYIVTSVPVNYWIVRRAARTETDYSNWAKAQFTGGVTKFLGASVWEAFDNAKMSVYFYRP